MSFEIKPETATLEKTKEKTERRVSLWRSWHIASLLVAVGISYLGFGVVSPLRTLYARAEGASGGEVGLMASAYLLSAFIFLLPFGWLSDRVSRIGLIVVGLLAHGLITLSYLWAANGELFIALRFIEGISSAAVFPAARALLADLVPPGRNGEAFGMMSAVMIFGILAGPPVGTFLADGLGFTAAYWCAATVFGPAALLVVLAFRNYRNTQVAKSAADISKESLTGVSKLFTGPIVLGCLIRIALSLGPSLGISIWSLYMADLGYSLPMIGWTYTVYAVPVLLVAPRAGRFSDRYGRLAMMFVGSIAVGFIWIGYGLITSFVLFLIVGMIEGSFIAVAESANDGYLADHSPANARGRAQALFNAAAQFGTLAGAFVSGFLYESDHRLPFFVLGATQVILMMVALVGLVVMQTRQARPVRSQVENC